MKKILNVSVLTTLLLLVFAMQLSAQDNAVSYKDVVVENPEPEVDMKVVVDYVNFCANGKLDELRGILSDNYMAYGPGAKDSVNTEQLINQWKENYKVQSNRKVTQITQTFRVLSGNLQGDWVNLWGTYNFTQNGKDLTLPFQLTAQVKDGKLERSTIYYNEVPLLLELGFTLTPPKE